MNFTIGQGREIYGESFTPEKDLMKNVHIVELPKEDSQTNVIPIKKNIDEEVIKNFLMVLNDKKIEYWLLEYSCLDCIKYGKIVGDKISLGVKNLKVRDEIIKLNEITRLNLEITVEDRKTKIFILYGMQIQVPIPVVAYLEKTFKQSWDELKND
jgi:hypothetical protein